MKLPEPDKEHPEPRDEFVDGPLAVALWPVPGDRPTENLPEGAPSWWQGEDQATNDFMRAMGIDPTKIEEGMGGSA